MPCILNETIKWSDGYHEIGLLWRNDSVCLSNTKLMAKDLFLGLEKRFRKDTELKNKMMIQMDEYLRKGYARIHNADELNVSYDCIWFLPVFPAFNPNKPEKLRILL